MFKNYRTTFINCEVNLMLNWSKNYITVDRTTQVVTTAAGDNLEISAINGPRREEFTISDTKIYAPVMTLSNKYNAVKNKVTATIKIWF